MIKLPCLLIRMTVTGISASFSLLRGVFVTCPMNASKGEQEQQRKDSSRLCDCEDKGGSLYLPSHCWRGYTPFFLPDVS